MRLNIRGKRKLNNSADVVKFLLKFLERTPEENDKECMWSVCLDMQNRVIDIDLVYIGTARGLPVRVAELFRAAVGCGACKLIIVHNHPAGTLYFTEEDLAVKEVLSNAGDILQIPLLDFIVFIRNGQFISAMTSALA